MCVVSAAIGLTSADAIQYALTPVLFPVALRGTGCGIASALSRLAGIAAPLLTGLLLAISPSLPLWTAAGLFAVAAGCMVALPYDG